MNAASDLTIERLREVLDYDPSTGVFRWLVGLSNRASAGSIAGSTAGNGYRRISIDGRTYLAQRLAWFHVTGTWPADEIDHRNGLPSDNRFANLRPATHLQNMQNLTRSTRRSRSGVLGVSYDGQRRRWVASITVNRRQKLLGRFLTVESAEAAYLAAKAEMHPFWAAS